MSSESRKRKSADYIYEDEPEKRLRRSTPRNHSTTPKAFSSAAAAKRRQNTLTQMKWIRSSHEDDENVDLDYDFTPVPTRRRSTRSKKPKLAQSETITQMDFLSPTLPDEQHMDLNADQPTGGSSPPPRTKEEPKVKKEEPPARSLHIRRIEKSSIEQVEQAAESKNATPRETLRDSRDQDEAQVQQQAAVPATPQHQSLNILRGEVPSSQSPPDSPLSTQRTKSTREHSRTPLKERSLNIIASRRPVGKGVLFPRKLEVADSMGSDLEDSQTPTQPQPTSKPSLHCYMPPAVRIRTDSQISERETFPDFNKKHCPVLGGRAKHLNTHIIADPEDSQEVEDRDEGKRKEPICGLETQAAYAAIVSSPNQRDEPWGERHAATPTTTDIRDFGSVAIKHKTPSIITLDEQPPERCLRASSEPTTPDVEDVDAPATPSRVSPQLNPEVESTPYQSQVLSAPSPPASTALIPAHHSQPQSQPLLPETESQFENAWRTISSPPELSPDIIPSSQPSLDAHLNEPASPAPITSFKIPPRPPRHLPSSPSQATTADVTQSQASTELLHIQTNPSSSLMLVAEESIQVPSSPSQATTTDETQLQPSLPPLPCRRQMSPSQRLSSSPAPPSLPPLSSSPLCARKGQEADAWMGHARGWNGMRRTDSQLLPDSLMNDSVAGPPGWGTQESLDEETCE